MLKKERRLIFPVIICALLANSVWAQHDFYGPDLGDTKFGIAGASMVSARDVRLNGSKLAGGVMAGREVHASGCHIAGIIKAGRDVYVESCPQVGGILAGRGATVLNSTVSQSVRTGRELILKSARLKQDAMAGGEVRLEDSTIEGALHAGSNLITLDRSQVGAIRVEASGNGNVIRTGGGIVSTHGNSVISQNGVTTISVGGNGTSSVNGFSVTGANGQTTVITPESGIYVNGKKVSGEGPQTYADYQSSRPGAPFIQGPGWQENVAGQYGMAPEAVIIIRNGSQVKGDIVFEGQNGKVLLYDQSSISGRVIGGKIENM